MANRFAVVASALPIVPSTPAAARSGLALVLDKLLRCFPSQNYCVITTMDEPPDNLDGSYYFLKSHHMPLFSLEQSLARSIKTRQASALQPLYRGLRRVYRAGKRLVYGTFASNAPRLIERRAQQICEIVQRENCALIVACSGELYDLPAGHRASQLAGVPFVAYILDYYGRGWPGAQGKVARQMEPGILKDAAAVIVTNERMAAIYRQQYGLEAAVIRNPCALPVPLPPAERGTLFAPGTVNIAYTGAIYSAHYDAFRRLIAAIRALNRADVKLHIFTSKPQSVLALEGISAPDVTFHGYLPPEEIARVQQQADILFLPLAFQSDMPELIATSAPGKTGEYLAAGRAVLVHAPPDSFLSWYFRQHNCGAVVDAPDVELLAQTLARLAADADWRAQLGQAARARAAADFDLAVVGPRFVETLEAAAGARFH